MEKVREITLVEDIDNEGEKTSIEYLTKIVTKINIDSNGDITYEYGYSSLPGRHPLYYDHNRQMVDFALLDTLIFNKFIEDLNWGVFYLENHKQSYIDAKVYRLYPKKYRTYNNTYHSVNKVHNNTLLTGNKDYTFGVELETSSGYIPQYLDKTLNMSCEYDGSLRPARGEEPVSGEYVTGVLKGTNGILHLQEICNELSKRCTVDHKCGVHVHLGNVDFSKSFIVYAYKLGVLIQNDLFEYLPASRRSSEYCRFLPILRSNTNFNFKQSKLEYDECIDKTYNEIFKMASGGHGSNQRLNKRHNHPKGAKVGYDHSNIRYCWLNLIPCMFNTRDNEAAKTIEFRNHNGTLNFTKVKNWLYFCMAFVNFVENNKKDIDNEYFTDSYGNISKITLPVLIEQCFSVSVAMKINTYFEKRKEYFNNTSSNVSPESREAGEYRKQRLNSIKKLTPKEIVI